MGLIRLQFVGARDLSSRVIAWYGHGLPVSHVDIVEPNGDLLGARSDSVGGQPPGVRVRPPGYAEWAFRLRVSLPCTDEVERRAHEFWRSQVGKPYDTRGLLGRFFVGRDWRSPDSWWCSELAARGLERDVSGYFTHALVSNSGGIDPADLVLVLSALVDVPLDLAAPAP